MTLNIYLASAMLLAPFIFTIAEWFGGHQTSTHRLAYSLIAAGLWPILAVGVAQLALIVAIRQTSTSRGVTQHHAVPDRKVQIGVPAR